MSVLKRWPSSEYKSNVMAPVHPAEELRWIDSIWL